MDRSLTVRIPAMRSFGMALLMVGAVALGIFLGMRLGGTLLSDPMGDALAGSELHQVYTVNGTVYLGEIRSRGANEMRLDRPALVRQASGDGSGAGGVFVQALLADPYDIAGSIAIRYEQVVMVGSVDPESQLAAAYRQAIGTETASPAPSAQ